MGKIDKISSGISSNWIALAKGSEKLASVRPGKFFGWFARWRGKKRERGSIETEDQFLIDIPHSLNENEGSIIQWSSGKDLESLAGWRPWSQDLLMVDPFKYHCNGCMDSNAEVMGQAYKFQPEFYSRKAIEAPSHSSSLLIESGDGLYLDAVILSFIILICAVIVLKCRQTILKMFSSTKDSSEDCDVPSRSIASPPVAVLAETPHKQEAGTPIGTRQSAFAISPIAQAESTARESPRALASNNSSSSSSSSRSRTNSSSSSRSSSMYVTTPLVKIARSTKKATSQKQQLHGLHFSEQEREGRSPVQLVISTPASVFSPSIASSSEPCSPEYSPGGDTLSAYKRKLQGMVGVMVQNSLKNEEEEKALDFDDLEAMLLGSSTCGPTASPERDANDGRVYNTLGNTAFSDGRFEDALQYYEMARAMYNNGGGSDESQACITRNIDVTMKKILQAAVESPAARKRLATAGSQPQELDTAPASAFSPVVSPRQSLLERVAPSGDLSPMLQPTPKRVSPDSVADFVDELDAFEAELSQGKM